MNKRLFCVMNPFDEMCNQKDIDCLAMAFLDNRQFVGKTVSQGFKLLLIAADWASKSNHLEPVKVQKQVL